MPEAMVFRLIAGVAEALQAIHAAGVVHRDLKPSNVLLAPDGPRVIDFGIARALEATALTRSGMMVGSPQFMAPEQIRDQPVTPAIDVFALGSLAAYAARGRSPFGEGHSAAVSYRVLHEPPDLDGCPPRLRALIESCLRKEAAARPAPGQILEVCLAHTAGAADPGWSPPSLASPASPALGPITVAQPTGRLIPPQSMINAVRLMYVGAALAGASILTTIATTPALKAAIRQQHPFAEPGGARRGDHRHPDGHHRRGADQHRRMARHGPQDEAWPARGAGPVHDLVRHRLPDRGPDLLPRARDRAHLDHRRGRMGDRPDRDRVLVGSAVERVFRAAAPGPVPGHSAVADITGR